MDEQVQDAPMAENTAPESSPDTNQPEESAPVSEDAQTQTEEPGEKAVPYSRFKEVNDQLRELKSSLSQTAQSAPLYEPNVGDTGLEPEAEAKLVELVKKAVAPELAGVTQYFRDQQANTAIEDTRRKYPDFDDHIAEVNQVMKAMPSLKSVDNPLETAYLITKGLTASQAVVAARKQGVEEAYKTIDNKIASRPGSPVPKKDSGGSSDLLKRFKAGKLSDNEVKANWTQLQQDLAEDSA